jgi:hypothetical protein
VARIRAKEVLTSALDVDKVDIMSRGVHHSPESHGVSDLSMEPDILVRRKEPS